MDKTSTFLGVISAWHAPTYYDQISDYRFLYTKNDIFFVIKYHYYNGYASFSTLIVPESSVNNINLYEKENESLYSEAIIIKDNYKSILEKLSIREHNEIESCMAQSQRDEKTIVLLLKAYELSGHSLI